MIRLRSWEEADTDTLVQLANNKNLWNYMRDMFPHPYTRTIAETWIRAAMSDDPLLRMAIEADGQVVGAAGIHLQSDVYRESAEIGYWVGEPFWHKGIAGEAVGLLIRHAFDKLTVNRLFASVFEGNTASMRVLEKNGFQPEGIRRKAVVKNGIYLDEYLFGLVRPGFAII